MPPQKNAPTTFPRLRASLEADMDDDVLNDDMVSCLELASA
jgi:hypothetical protein